MYKLTRGNFLFIDIVGAGNGHDAYEKLKAGATVVQIYSRMTYRYAGPGVVSRRAHGREWAEMRGGCGWIGSCEYLLGEK